MKVSSSVVADRIKDCFAQRRQASFIVVDSGDEDEYDGPAAPMNAARESIHSKRTHLAAGSYDGHATPKDCLGTSNDSAKLAFTCEPNLTHGIPAHFQGLAKYLYDISVPHPADWTLVRLANRLRIFRDDDFADGWMNSADYYENPLLTRELVLGSPSVIAQYLLDVKDTRSWDVGAAWQHTRQKTQFMCRTNHMVDEDTAVYAKPIHSCPFDISANCCTLFCISDHQTFGKRFGTVFHSDAPSLCLTSISRSNEVKARMRGGFG